jgi:DNA-binding NtrC family response regulator
MVERKRILVVDDDRHVLFVLRHTLAGLGDRCDILVASNGYDAAETISQGTLDLLITDIRLPGPDGIQLTRALRERCKDTPVIWITAHHEPGLPALARRLGVHCYLEKPLEIDRIRAVVRAALHIGHEEGEPPDEGCDTCP